MFDMRLTPIVFAVFLLLSGCSSDGGQTDSNAGTGNDTPSDSMRTSLELDKSLRQELIQRGGIDQAIRRQLQQTGPADSLLSEMRLIDSLNTVFLKAVVDEYGWPDTSVVGPKGINAAWLLLQHSPDPQFQERMLPELQQAYENGMLSGENLALLTDRVKVHQNEPQIYGSQLYQDPDGRHRFFEIENAGNVDARRQSLGMMPLAEYARLIEQNYGSEVVMPGEED